LGAAGRVKLVGDVLGVATNALAKLLELGLQLNDGRARSSGIGGQRGAGGLEVGRATLALGVDASRARSSSSR
jgi:hypothetical protein